MLKKNARKWKYNHSKQDTHQRKFNSRLVRKWRYSSRAKFHFATPTAVLNYYKDNFF